MPAVESELSEPKGRASPRVDKGRPFARGATQRRRRSFRRLFMYVTKNGKKRKCVAANCQLCGVAFSAIEYEVNRGGGKFCSRYCSRVAQAKINCESRKLGISRSERTLAWRKSVSLEVHAAHNAVEAALANKSLVRKPCEVCGAIRVDAHHDDYSKPLDIRWLCRSHHLQHHRSK